MRLPVSYGNMKLDGGNVMVYNMTSARSCPADRLGMCPLGRLHGDGKCYAWKAERLRPSVRAYRNRQELYWRTSYDPDDFVEALREQTDYFRFSEAGDFAAQEDVEKMALLCKTLRRTAGIKCYGYTRRVDLDLTPLLDAKVSLCATADAVPEGAIRVTVIGRKEPVPEGCHLCPGKRCMTECKACASRGKVKAIAIRKH